LMQTVTVMPILMMIGCMIILRRGMGIITCLPPKTGVIPGAYACFWRSI